MSDKPPATVGVVDAALALGRRRTPTPRGIVSKAAFDEDAVTLAAKAGLAVLDRNPEVDLRSVIVSTLSAPLLEPGVAPFLCEVFDLGSESRSISVFEVGGSVSAGLGAVDIGADQIELGRGPVLVIATDVRFDVRGRSLGAGAVALLLDGDGEVAELTSKPSGAGLFLDRWQRRDHVGVAVGDRSLDAFGPSRGSLTDGSDGRLLNTFSAGPALSRVGFPGTAGPFVALLIEPLENGQEIILTSSAGGLSRALSVVAGPEWSRVTKSANEEVTGGLEGEEDQQIDESQFSPYHSQSAAFRDQPQTFRLEAVRDVNSGKVHFPPPPHLRDSEVERISLARQGRVVTFARDHVYPFGSPLTMAVVDLDGGGRFFGQVADGLTVQVGDHVELVLRRLHDGGGVPNYFWKVQPSPQGGA